MSEPSADLAKRIKRFHKVNAERKALEKEEEALRSYFKRESAGIEVVFQTEGPRGSLLEVPVTEETTKRFDQEKFLLEQGDDELAKFQKVTTYWKVSARVAKSNPGVLTVKKRRAAA